MAECPWTVLVGWAVRPVRRPALCRRIASSCRKANSVCWLVVLSTCNSERACRTEDRGGGTDEQACALMQLDRARPGPGQRLASAPVHITRNSTASAEAPRCRMPGPWWTGGVRSAQQCPVSSSSRQRADAQRVRVGVGDVLQTQVSFACSGGLNGPRSRPWCLVVAAGLQLCGCGTRAAHAQRSYLLSGDMISACMRHPQLVAGQVPCRPAKFLPKRCTHADTQESWSAWRGKRFVRQHT